MFVDQVVITVQAGDGGSGSCSFLREKFVPLGGPDGGDGGKGGDIILRADSNLSTLIDLRYKKLYEAESGHNGQGQQRTGRSGGDLIIRLPRGTLVKDAATGGVLVDLTGDGQVYMLAAGGRGGRGNARFKSSTNRAPRQFEPGQPGGRCTVTLELKLLADVGIIGFPNAGKSTLIAKISNARPKIADYPFSTLAPNLGVVRVGEGFSFVAADIPGLIEGAHLGKGLGIQFLKHTERTRLLVHLLDFSAGCGRDPVADYQVIQNELRHFSEELYSKPQILAPSKIDHPEAEQKLAACMERLRELNPLVFPLSSLTGKGMEELLFQVKSMLLPGKAGAGEG